MPPNYRAMPREDRSRQDRCMPIPVVLVLAAFAFVVLVCLTLWVIAEANRRPGADRFEADPKP
jgi:hypothetical protein